MPKPAVVLAADTAYPPDPLTVELCQDGMLPLAKLTPEEQTAAVAGLHDRGHGPTEIARRCHGTTGLVNAALGRAKTREDAAT
jgi:hypothetical protein